MKAPFEPKHMRMLRDIVIQKPKVNFFFNILWTVHLHIILVDNEIDAQIFYITFIYLFKYSTCFEQLCVYRQEDNYLNTTSGTITLW
jgi:hypothetical protein